MTQSLDEARKAYEAAEAAYVQAAIEHDEVITIGSDTIYPSKLAIAKELGYDSLEEEDAEDEVKSFLRNFYYDEGDLPIWISSSETC